MKFKALFKFDVFRFALILVDACVMVLAMLLAYSLVFDGDIPSTFRLQIPYATGVVLFSTMAVFSFLGIYSRRIPLITERESRLIVMGSLVAGGSSFALMTLLNSGYWSYLIVFWLFTFVIRSAVGVYASYRAAFFPAWQLYVVPISAGLLGIVSLRLQNLSLLVPEPSLPVSKTIHALYFLGSLAGFLLVRWGLHWVYAWVKLPVRKQPRAILIGADLELALFSHFNSMSHGYQVVAILDNDPLKWGVWIRDARVVGRIALLGDVVAQYNADTVLLLKDSLPIEEIRQVEEHCRNASVRLVRLGGLQESLLRSDSLSTSDLLERKEYRFLPSDKENYLKQKQVLVTGAGGSIGSELVRQILRCDPKLVVLLGRGENSIFELERELQQAGVLAKTKSVIVSVVDSAGLMSVFESFHPEVVFHAAAHKHVPLMEANVREAVQNNILGTRNVMELAGRMGVEKVVMISTDKAVAPLSVMGATKRKAEQVVAQAAVCYPRTHYSVVRFGNVLGSRGSVVRLFLDQIRRGGPVTVTDPRMTRFFMTIPEAVSLVLATGCLNSGFGIYVLEMGKPYRIADLAEKMIRMCGLEPGRDIKIEFTGVRSGEKIEEVLTTGEEVLETTSNSSIRRVKLDAQKEQNHILPEKILQQNEQELRHWLLGSGNSK